jgi:hypothetical protein
MRERHRPALYWAALVVAAATSGGCDWVWPFDGPYDPWRCQPACSANERCVNGRCLPTEDGSIADGSAGDGGALDSAADQQVPPPPPNCGNSKLDPGEPCDGTKLGGKNCTSFGFDDGLLACTMQCQYDTSGCHKCGDGKVSGTEDCEQALGLSKTCQDLGFDGGVLACTSSCSFETKSCTKCGDGTIAGTESCDLTNFGGKTCASFGFFAGDLVCTGTCSIDSTGCHDCGNNIINVGEDCEGIALKGETCATQGFEGGALACDSTCAYDTSGCYKCGDGVANGDEDCDGADYGNKDCITEGFDTGTVGCSSGCTLDTSGCTFTNCGDAVKDGGEQCDGADYGGKDCVTEGWDYGPLACAANCVIDTSGCKMTCTAPTPPAGLTPDLIVSVSTGNDAKADGKCVPYRTIGAALKVAQSGQIVWVAPGSYTEASGEAFPIQLPAGVYLRGDDANKGEGTVPTELAGAGDTTYGPSGSDSCKATLVLGAGSAVAGFRVDVGSGGLDYGIVADTVAGIIANNTFAGGGVVLACQNFGTQAPAISGNVFKGSMGINAVLGFQQCAPVVEKNTFLSGASVYNNHGTMTVKDNTINSMVLLNGGTTSFELNQFGATGWVHMYSPATATLRKNVCSAGSNPALTTYTSAQPGPAAVADLGTSSDPGANDFSARTGTIIDHQTATVIQAIGNLWPTTPPTCGAQIKVTGGGGVVWGSGTGEYCQ